MTTATTLKNQVAIVAGATRGAGRGIARMLGEAGATVYCTGRSSRSGSRASPRAQAGRPETIEETAELVTAAGGVGIPLRVDHTREEEVAALFDRVDKEQHRLDVLALVMTGEPASWQPFLDEKPAAGRAFVEGWIWPHILTAWHATKLMTPRRSGLIIELVEQHNIGNHGAFYFDLMETLLKRLVFALANDVGHLGVTAVAVGPGFMRTEAILESFGVTEANWKDALTDSRATAGGWAGSETPCLVGRAIAALAADAQVSKKNGGIYTVRALSEQYGFTDINGAVPDYAALDAAFEQAQKTYLAPMIDAARYAVVDWKLEVKPQVECPQRNRRSTVRQ
jgi:NAD(P)-dependent dehydrogenase (short-subunit alcohol dehydrogenase family)